VADRLLLRVPAHLLQERHQQRLRALAAGSQLRPPGQPGKERMIGQRHCRAVMVVERGGHL